MRVQQFLPNAFSAVTSNSSVPYW